MLNVRLALVVTLAVCAAACRQADGPIPTPVGDQSNEIHDISRDLVNVANKDAQAPEELRSDLAKYGERPEHVQQINELAKEIAGALPGARLDDQTAKSLANTLWVALVGKELSERQIAALGREVKAGLASTGVAEERAQAIADRLQRVQSAMTDNPRRWYQVF